MAQFFRDIAFETTLGTSKDILLETPGYGYEVVQAGAAPFDCRIYRTSVRAGQAQAVDDSAPSEPAAPLGVVVGDFDALIVRTNGLQAGKWKIRVWTTRQMGVADAPRGDQVRRMILAHSTSSPTIAGGSLSAPLDLSTSAVIGYGMQNEGIAWLDNSGPWPIGEIREELPYLDGVITGSSEFVLLVYHVHDWLTTTRKFDLLATYSSWQPKSEVRGGTGTLPHTTDNWPSDVDSNNYRERHIIDLSNGAALDGPNVAAGTNVSVSLRQGLLLPTGQIKLFIAWDFAIAFNFKAVLGLRSK